jgi:hypothetical protein
MVANCPMPVALPPGLLRLSTRPNLTGSPPVRNIMGTELVAAFAATAEGVPPAVAMTATGRCTSSCAISRTVVTALGPTILDVDVAALDEAGFLKTQAEGRNQVSRFCR